MEQNSKDTTLYLVRHGTTAWNQALRYQGQTDNPLDEIGERQGACLEEYFKDLVVVSYNEIESNVELQSVGMVTA